eukprot:1861519-Alexandrium_andersonii.AAC.1
MENVRALTSTSRASACARTSCGTWSDRQWASRQLRSESGGPGAPRVRPSKEGLGWGSRTQNADVVCHAARGARD